MTERSSAESGLDPAATLAVQRGPRAYSPGFYGTIRLRLPSFVGAGAISLVIALIPFPTQHVAMVVAAIAIFVALTALAFTLPWPRLPQWSWSLIPIGYIGATALIRDAQGGASAGLTTLFILPVIWLAFYGKRSHLVLGLVAVAAALVLPTLLIGAPTYPPDQWRMIAVTLIVTTVISFSFLAMVSRDRSYVTDLAQQSLLARQAAHAAENAVEQLASLLRAATETAIIGVDSKSIVTFFSAGAEKILGYRPDEVVGRRSVFDFVDQVELGRRGNEVDHLIDVADGKVLGTGDESIWTYVRKDDTRRRVSVVVTSQPAADGLGGYVVVAGDVTDREQLVAERERLLAAQREVSEMLVAQNARLREVTKMKDDVVATVSHELRTPLTSIRGFVELLLEDESGVSLDDEQVHMLRTIDRSSLHLLRVADDLLIDPGGSHGLQLQFVDADLALVAEKAIGAIQGAAVERGIRLSLITDGDVVVHGDPARLYQLVSNLLSNAVKFAAAGGRVTVHVALIGQVARIDVLDDGPGIPEHERPHLFDRFYRLASTPGEAIPGSGLGLAIARSVVEAHDGTVEIVDTPGWSTTFRVHLPVNRHQTGIVVESDQGSSTASTMTRTAVHSEGPAPSEQ